MENHELDSTTRYGSAEGHVPILVIDITTANPLRSDVQNLGLTNTIESNQHPSGHLGGLTILPFATMPSHIYVIMPGEVLKIIESSHWI